MELLAQELILAQVERFGMFLHIVVNVLKLPIGMVSSVWLFHNAKEDKLLIAITCACV